jgi:hypothetical protein
VNFSLSVGTKPNVVKFEVEGTATLDGRDEEIRTILEPDPETQIPLVFQRVYQHVFMSMYLLATLMDTPYPPANLLYSNQQQIASLQMSDSAPTTQEEAQLESPTTEAPEAERETQPIITNTAPSEERATSELERPPEPEAGPQTRETTSPT